MTDWSVQATKDNVLSASDLVMLKSVMNIIERATLRDRGPRRALRMRERSRWQSRLPVHAGAGEHPCTATAFPA